MNSAPVFPRITHGKVSIHLYPEIPNRLIALGLALA
jgi:hypothetical protein